MKTTTPILRFGWGPGPGSRMLSPGLPDALFGDGTSLGWLNSDGAWRLVGDTVYFAPIAGPVGIVTSPTSWAVLSGDEGAWVVNLIDWGAQSVQRHPFRDRSVRPGCRWVVADSGWERTVRDVTGAAAPRTPMGAREARPHPWPDGQGIVWVGQTSVYRMGADGQVHAVGSLPTVPQGFSVGPGGSAVFATNKGTWGLAPKRPLCRLPDIDVTGARFSADGQRLLGSTADGVIEVDLGTGSVLRAQGGDLQPVGYAPDAAVLEERTGVVRSLGGDILAKGFCPSASARLGANLYGPGGTAWDLETGRAIWSHAPLKCEHLAVVSGQIVCIDEEFEVYDADGERLRHVAVPIDGETEGPIYDVQGDPPDHVLIELEEEVVRVGLDGQRVGSPLPLTDLLEEEAQGDEGGCSWACDPDGPVVSYTDAGSGRAVEWPIYAEQVAAAGGRGWCWSDDGMLIGLVP